MGIKLFGWASDRAAALRAAETPAPREAQPAGGKCPPCTGRCFQGRACPASDSADPVLVALLRRSPQHSR